MQAKNQEKICCFSQLFDYQTDIFLKKSAISGFVCAENRFFAIFAPSLIQYFIS
jgi:hypothetical protein